MILRYERSISVGWHPTMNGINMLNQFSYASSKRIWWKCSVCENEWETTIAHRTRGQDCPECALKTSIYEELPRQWEEICEEIASV